MPRRSFPFRLFLFSLVLLFAGWEKGFASPAEAGLAPAKGELARESRPAAGENRPAMEDQLTEKQPGDDTIAPGTREATPGPSPQVEARPLVYQLDLVEEVGPAALRKIKNGFEEAERLGAEYLLLHMNTYGGLLDAADSIRTRLLKAPVTTIAYINNNAASAGALIAIACDSIYMHQGATIGAASVVNQTGEIMPEKYQSYMRSMMRATAEVNGRDPRIAEAFVDPVVEIPGIVAAGKVLTFTSREALKYGYCDGIAANIAEALKMAGLSDYELVRPEVTWTDRVIDFLINPVVSGLLLMLIIGGIYFEMQTPGIGFAIVVSAVAALLYFMPLYLEGLAANWEILLFIVGLLLLILEIFVIPGFGVAGILGIVCVVCGLAFSLVLNDYFNFSISGGNLVNAFLLVVISIIATTALAFIFGKNIFKSSVFKKLMLLDEQRSSEGYVGTERTNDLTGQAGVALTDLRPSGKIEIDGKRYDALSEGSFLAKGTEIEVVKHETFSIFVRRKK